MDNDLISRSVLIQSLRNNVLVDMTPNLEQAIEEQPAIILNEHEKAKECLTFLKNYCKANGSNCTMDCPFAFKDYAVHCNLGGRQMYPCEWKTTQEEWKKK